jgi:hypothetical protein
LHLPVPNSLFLPRTSTATTTLLNFTVFTHWLYKRERGLQLDSVLVINVLGNDHIWSLYYGNNKFFTSHLKCQRFLCVHVSSSCNIVLLPVAIQMSVFSESKQLQFTRLHTNCSVSVKLFYLLVYYGSRVFLFLSRSFNVSGVKACTCVLV